MQFTFLNLVEDTEHLFQSMIMSCLVFYFIAFVMNKFSIICQPLLTILLLQLCNLLIDTFSLLSLYRGKVALDVAEAQHLMEGLDWQGAVKDIQASVKWLKSNGSTKVVLFSSFLFFHFLFVFKYLYPKLLEKLLYLFCSLMFYAALLCLCLSVLSSFSFINRRKVC